MDEEGCVPCHAMGTNCTTVGVTVATLPLLADWWRLPNSTQLERCFAISNCTGGSDALQLCGEGYEVKLSLSLSCTAYYNHILTFPYTSQGAFCGVCSEDSNGTSYHRSVGRCEPCKGSILPVIVSAVVALAALLALLVVLRTSRGRKLLIKLDVSKRVSKYMDPYEKGTAEVRENTEDYQPSLASKMKFGLPDISLPSIFLTLTLKFPDVKWPKLPPGRLYSLQLPECDLPAFRLCYPGLQWPPVPNLAYVCNLARIAFPDLQ